MSLKERLKAEAKASAAKMPAGVLTIKNGQALIANIDGTGINP